MNVRRWMHEHSLKLLAIRDTPEAIAAGVAIGVFFGFAPVFGLKTALAIFCAWITRSNVLAAVLAATAHEIAFPVMWAVYLFEYDLGCWILNGQWPGLRHISLGWQTWRHWATFLAVGKPLLAGAIVSCAPFSLAAYFTTKGIVARHQRKKRQRESAAHAGKR